MIRRALTAYRWHRARRYRPTATRTTHHTRTRTR